jgi:hypothetical protein
MDTKLRETKFFFEKLASESKKAVTDESEAFPFYFNAFLEAGYGLRDLLARNSFKPSSRPEDERSILDFMREQRRIVVHRGRSAGRNQLGVHPASCRFGARPQPSCLWLSLFCDSASSPS